MLGDADAFSRLLVGDPRGRQRRGCEGRGPPEALAAERSTPGVTSARFKDYLTVNAAGVGSQLTVMQGYAEQVESSVYEGRDPQHANEAAIGRLLAQQAGLGIGDPVEVRIGNHSHRCVVVGLISTVQFGGMRVNLTADGYRQLVPGYQPMNIDVTVDEGIDPRRVVDALRTSPLVNPATVVNQRETIRSELSVYITMCRWLAIGILVVTGTVAALVVGLMASTLLARERRAFGLRKALGFSGAQVMGQLVVSYLPSALLVIVAGLVAGTLTTPWVLLAGLQSIGIMRLDVSQDVALLASVGAGLALLAVVVVLVGANPLLRRSSLELMNA